MRARAGALLLLCVTADRAMAQREASSREASPRDGWTAYRAASQADHARDSLFVAAELGALGRTTWTTPAVSPDFRVAPYMTGAWFATDSAAHVAANIISFQTPSGGWAKHVDMVGESRRPGVSFFSESADWSYIATIDNGATVTQLRFLGAALDARKETAWQQAFARGITYLLRAQLPSGGWPQVYPLQGGYHDATTYNDDATVGVLRLLRDVASGRYALVSENMRGDASAAFDRGVAGILADQVRVRDTLTVWAQQHDPVTRAPVKARSYELAGITAGESSGILELLMSIESPTPAIVRSVHAGVAWLRGHPVRAIRYDSLTGTYVPDAKAPPTWARIYETPGFRPVMANRDGVPRYDFSELTDRRTGYAWFIQRPASVLKAYDTWARRHPQREH